MIRLLKMLMFSVVLAGVGLVVVVVTAAALHWPSDSRAFAQGRQPGDRAERRPRALSLLTGRGAAIGVSVRDVMPAEAGGQPQAGVLIDEVRPDSPADKAGIKRGDIIVEFDGERVRSARQFSRLVQETTPGRTVTAAILRDNRRSEVRVTPDDERRGDVMISGDFGDYIRDRFPTFDFNLDLDLPGFPNSRRLGVTVDTLTNQLADHFGAKGGVLVTSVTEGSAASRAGLKAGDVITSINGQRIESREDLLRALRDADRDGRDSNVDLNIGIVRDKKESTVKATLESRRPIRGRPV